MDNLHFSFDAQTLCEAELTNAQQELIKKAREAVNEAYAPYSHFYVGAAVRLQSGIIIKGCNQENVAYPSGLCAERVALFSAATQYPEDPVIELALIARSKNKFTETFTTPCGSCRQVLLETEHRYKSPIRLLLVSKEKVLIIEKSSSLLPFFFTM
ncbi:MAG: cytidine deaminase [Bacteroidaceae bacterium]